MCECECLLKVEIGIINWYRMVRAYEHSRGNPFRVPELSFVVSFHHLLRFGAENGMAAVIDSTYIYTYTDVGFRYHTLYVFMPVHSHLFLIVIRIRLVYQI